MDSADLFSEERLDYLEEMLNIGAGNAATALSQLLHCVVDMKQPAIHVVPATKATSDFGDPAVPVACVRMRTVGDLTGFVFLIVPDEQKASLTRLAELSMLGPKGRNPDPDRVVATLAEIGNILAGVYLTAIHDFCKLNVYHSSPIVAIDMMQAVLDETIATQSDQGQSIISVTNEFMIGKGGFRAFFLIIPNRDSVRVLLDSMTVAGKIYGYEPD